MKNYYDEALILYAKELISLTHSSLIKIDDLSVLSIGEIEREIKNIVKSYNTNSETFFDIVYLAGRVQNGISEQLELDVGYFTELYMSGLNQLFKFPKFIKETCLNI